MKQTAVEWLKKEFEDYGSSSHLNLDWTTFDELCEQAKQMEKEQIIEAHHSASIEQGALSKDLANDYYNETFKSE